jgi:hypothetical protein
VRPDDYRAYTDELRARLADDARVIGLVAVGSMADRDYAPDEWSDHDFFVITKPGEQEALRRDLSWLPDPDRIALSFRETEHGLKVIDDQGHMVEFAVFDREEIALAGVNRFRVLLDRGGVGERVAAVRSNPRPSATDEFLFGMTVASALVAAGRGRRGELLSAAFFVTWTLKHLTALLLRVMPSDDASLLDEFDSLRRFERAHPALGAELAEIVRRAPTAVTSLIKIGSLPN